MTQEQTDQNKQPRKILFVDDAEVARKMLSKVASRSGIEDFEVLEDADSAVARLHELEGTPASIVSDGLNGSWKDVIAAAKEAKVPAVVYSSDKYLQTEVEEAGAGFLDKGADLEEVKAMLLELQNPGSTQS